MKIKCSYKCTYNCRFKCTIFCTHMIVTVICDYPERLFPIHVREELTTYLHARGQL